jgi:hypothetical protein
MRWGVRNAINKFPSRYYKLKKASDRKEKQIMDKIDGIINDNLGKRTPVRSLELALAVKAGTKAREVSGKAATKAGKVFAEQYKKQRLSTEQKQAIKGKAIEIGKDAAGRAIGLAITYSALKLYIKYSR